MALQLLIIVGLVAIIYQDFRERAINIYWLAFTGILLSVDAILLHPLALIIEFSSINIAILLFEIGFVWLYFTLRYRRRVNLTEEFLGWGDIFFLLVLTVSFHPILYVMFVLLSCLVALIAYGLLAKVDKIERTIPFAAILAIGYLIIVIGNIWFNFDTFSGEGVIPQLP